MVSASRDLEETAARGCQLIACLAAEERVLS